MNKIKGLTAEEWLKNGARLWNENRYEEAIEACSNAIYLDSTLGNAYLSRGIAKCSLGNYEAAIMDFDSAIQLNPYFDQAYNGRGNIKSDIGRKEDAIKDYDIAIQLNPNYANAYFNRGRSKSDIGRKEDAIKDYDIAIQLNPNYAIAYNNRGNTKSALGRNEDAIKDYDIAIQLNPNDYNTYFNRGVSKSDLGRNDAAIRDYDIAIQLNPNGYYIYNNRGIAKSDLGRKKDAIIDYNIAIQLNSNYASAYNNRGNAKADLGRNEDAIKDYDIAIQLNPNDALAYLNRTLVYKFFIKEGKVEYRQELLPNLIAFCFLANEKELLEKLSGVVITFKEYNLSAPLLLQDLLTKYGNNDKDWFINPFWQNVIDDCRRPNLFLSDIETDYYLLDEEKAFLAGLIYFLYGQPAKGHVIFKELYDKKSQNRTAYYLLASMRTYLRPIDDDFFDAILRGIAPISEGTSLDNYYAALLFLSDESFMEALEYLDATDRLFLPALYAKVVCLHELKRNTDAVVKQILEAEQLNFQNLGGGYLKDFDIETYLRFQKNWHNGLQKYAHYHEISGGIYLVLSILSDDAQGRGRFHAYQDFLGENSLTRDFKVHKNYVSKSKKEDLTIPTSYGLPFNKPLNAEEQAAEAALFDTQMETLRLKYVDKIEEFDKVSSSNEPEYIEIKIADWVTKRAAMKLSEEQLGEILTYFTGKDKISHLQKFYLFKFAELNFQLDAKARTLEKGKYERWLIQYVLKKGAQALIDPLNLTDELKELVGNAIQDNIDSFVEQYELLKYVPYGYFKTNVTYILS